MTALELLGFVPSPAVAALRPQLSALGVVPVTIEASPLGELAIAALAAGPLPIDPQRSPAQMRLLQLQRHHRALEICAVAGPVLPCRSDTRVDDAAAAAMLLRLYGTRLRRAMREAAELVQVALTIVWDVPSVLRRLQAQGRLEGLAGAAPEAVARAVASRLDEERSRLQASIGPQLAAMAREIQVVERPEPEIVYAATVLIDRNAEPEFDAVLERLDGELGGDLTFRCVGPLPPLDFVAVQIERVAPDAVRDAREMLGLAQEIDPEALGRAYRLCVRKAHPDTSDPAHGNAATVQAIQDAYRLLSRVVDAAAEIGDGFAATTPAFLIDVPSPARRAA